MERPEFRSIRMDLAGFEFLQINGIRVSGFFIRVHPYYHENFGHLRKCFQGTARGRSADWQSAVSPNGIRQNVVPGDHVRFGCGQRTANPRYGRIQFCATSVAAAPRCVHRWFNKFATAPRQGKLKFVSLQVYQWMEAFDTSPSIPRPARDGEDHSLGALLRQIEFVPLCSFADQLWLPPSALRILLLATGCEAPPATPVAGVVPQSCRVEIGAVAGRLLARLRLLTGC